VNKNTNHKLDPDYEPTLDELRPEAELSRLRWLREAVVKAIEQEDVGTWNADDYRKTLLKIQSALDDSQADAGDVWECPRCGAHREYVVGACPNCTLKTKEELDGWEGADRL
jgi:rubrerythrin